MRVCVCVFSHALTSLETNLASHWVGVRLPWASGKSPDFPRSSPDFPGSSPATSPEVLSLWNLTAIQRFPGSLSDFPRTSPNFPGTSPEVSPFLWEAWHPLLTHKNFLWQMTWLGLTWRPYESLSEDSTGRPDPRADRTDWQTDRRTDEQEREHWQREN